MIREPGVILLAHGTKEPEASAPVHHYARRLAARTGLRVEPCLREFIEPSVPTVVGALYRDGYRKILVLPFFLFKSGHVTRDIAADLAAEKARFTDLEFTVGEPLGEDGLLEDLLFRRLREARRA